MSGGLLGLRTKNVTAKYDILKHVLYIVVSRTMALLWTDLTTSVVIKSNPGDFLRLYF